MGLILCTALLDLFRRTREAKVLMLGPRGGGKTTILYKLKLNKTITNVPPTLGFNVETLKPANNLIFTVWDLGTQERLKLLWPKHYFRGCDGLIYVVDSSNLDGISPAREELAWILSETE